MFKKILKKLNKTRLGASEAEKILIGNVGFPPVNQEVVILDYIKLITVNNRLG